MEEEDEEEDAEEEATVFLMCLAMLKWGLSAAESTSC